MPVILRTNREGKEREKLREKGEQFEARNSSEWKPSCAPFYFPFFYSISNAISSAFCTILFRCVLGGQLLGGFPFRRFYHWESRNTLAWKWKSVVVIGAKRKLSSFFPLFWFVSTFVPPKFRLLCFSIAFSFRLRVCGLCRNNLRRWVFIFGRQQFAVIVYSILVEK